LLREIGNPPFKKGKLKQKWSRMTFEYKAILLY